MPDIEARIHEIGMGLFKAADEYRSGISRQALNGRLMAWATGDPQLKTQLFRFVDVLPMLPSDEDLLKHLVEYLCTPDLCFPIFGTTGQEWLRRLAGHPLSRNTLARLVRGQIGAMARNFIAGSTAPEAIAHARRLRKKWMAFTMDILGEVTLSDIEARTYQQQYLGLIDALCADAASWPKNAKLDGVGKEARPRVNLSLKLSALTAQFEPADPESTAKAVSAALRPILLCAKEQGAFINIDMEHYAVKDVTLRIVRDILLDAEFADWPHLGFVLQAYLRDTERDLADLLEATQTRPSPFSIRLVKGAYWDYETIIARQHNWPVPVFTDKAETDANFERLTQTLLAQYPRVQLAIGSHNVRSIAATMANAEALGLPSHAVEYQMLYGMGDQLKHSMLRHGQRVRVYTPFGQLIPGMAYLVRRLLENTANESFLFQGFTKGVSKEDLLCNPTAISSATSDARKEGGGFLNIPERNFSLDQDQQRMRSALAKVRAGLGQLKPLIIGGEEVITKREIASINPAHPEEVVGRVASAGTDDGERAVRAAREAFPTWRNTKPSVRAAILRRAADIAVAERDELAALQVFEVGKTWREADADVCETIDYLNYSADEMERLAPARLMNPVPGETNTYHYEPKGIAVILPPWNFPMAICAGMTAAALVTGNTAILKPASQSPMIAAAFVDMLHRAGLPNGVLNFLPGPGEEVGEYLVRHPDIHLIAFTGSREVGCRINRLAADVVPGQRHLKKVIAEMGGKNAIIVDADADLDDAVQGVVQSAFGYQGQKCSACSRVIVLRPIYEQFVSRLIEATRSLSIGPPEDPGNYMGPVIDERAQRKIREYIEIGKTEAALALERDVSHLDGYYVGPTIFIDVPPTAVIAREEIFGPVLSVIPAEILDEALAIALDVDYALTGGMYSRNPKHIALARLSFNVGNLYINRKITGAIVGRQPFGGFKLSGIGSKAGGPDYLLQFMVPRTITENTLRRGFAPK